VEESGVWGRRVARLVRDGASGEDGDKGVDDLGGSDSGDVAIRGAAGIRDAERVIKGVGVVGRRDSLGEDVVETFRLGG
jgi:hypothetical protein